MEYPLLTAKKKKLASLGSPAPELEKNLTEWFKVELTYTSNAIEGNTLSRRETALVIEKGITVGGKSLTEHLEASNHAKAIDLVADLQKRKNKIIEEKDILAIHAMILHGIDDVNAGCYRRVPVRISGSSVVMPNAAKVPALIEDFLAWLNSNKKLHPVLLAGEAHYQLVTIHPFVDGNGRTARLVMNLILQLAGYPPAIIRKRDRLAYISSLETAQLGGSKSAFEKIIYQAVDRSLDIYLDAMQGKEARDLGDQEALLKIGQLAKAVGETVPTIRFWTKEGLLEVAELTKSGYQLFAPDMIERCKKIQSLKSSRLTLQEIRKQMFGDAPPSAKR